jgi:hypothetical protein
VHSALTNLPQQISSSESTAASTGQFDEDSPLEDYVKPTPPHSPPALKYFTYNLPCYAKFLPKSLFSHLLHPLLLRLFDS